MAWDPVQYGRQVEFDQNMRRQTQAMEEQARIARQQANGSSGGGFFGSISGGAISSAGVGALLLIIGVIWFIKNFWMYLVAVAIAGLCVFICIKIYQNAIKPLTPILITIGVSIALILVVIIVPNVNKSKTATQTRVQTPTTQTRYMLVNSDALNVRSGPSVDHGVVGRLNKNTRVQILSSSGEWWKIKSGNIEGYVNSTFLKKE